MVGLKLKLSKKRPSNRSALACLKITNKKVLEIYKKYLIYISKFALLVKARAAVPF